MLYFSIPPPCKAQKPTMKKNCCVIFQHPAALQGPKNLYKEGNRCVIFQHSAALKGPKTSIKRGIAVLYFSIPPPCKAQKTSMKRNRCVILQHSAALQGPKTALLYGRRFLWRIPASARRAGADIWMPSGSYYSKADAAGMLSRTHCALIDGPDR